MDPFSFKHVCFSVLQELKKTLKIVYISRKNRVPCPVSLSLPLLLPTQITDRLRKLGQGNRGAAGLHVLHQL